MIKKIVLLLAFVTLLPICVIFVVMNYLNYDAATNHFAKELQISPANIAKIKLIKFPIPHLHIDYIKENGRIELENVEIHFVPLSLLTFKPQISVVKVYNAKLYTDAESFNIVNHDQIIASFIKSSMPDIDFDVKNLTILNQNNQAILTFSNCNLHNNSSLSKGTSFGGTVSNIGKFSGAFETKDEQIDFNLKITNADFDFHLSEIYTNFRLSSGKGEYLIRNMANLLHQLIPDLDSIARRFKKSEMVNIKFDIMPTEQLLKLENVIIGSNPFAGSGVIYLSKYPNITSMIKLHMAKIDTQSLLTTTSDFNKLSDSVYDLRFIFGDKSVDTNIIIDQIMLGNGEILNNTKLALNLNQGIFLVNDFSGTINSGGSFKFVGKITQNSVRSIFDGTVYLQHSDLNSVLKTLGHQEAVSDQVTPFTLSSDLRLTLIDVYLQNFLLQIENTKVSGSITTRFIGSMPHLMASLDFSSIDLSKKGYPVLSPIIDYAKSLFQDMKDQSYLSKYIPIRTVSFLGTLDINFNDLQFGEDLFSKAYILANISPGNIEINNFDIRKGQDYLNVSGNLLASSIKPKFTVKINDGTLNVDFLTPGSMLNLRNKLLSNFDLEKIDLNIDCNLSKIVQKSLILQNLKVDLDNNNNLFNLSDISADVLGGKLQATGNITLEPYSINFVYALNSIDLAKLSSALPKGWLDTYGGLSINGSFSTSGNSLEELLYQLSSNSEFLVKNSKINNFSIDQLVEKVNGKTYNSASLQEDVDIALSQGQTELLNMQGKLQLEKGVILMKNAVFNTKYTSGSVASAINIYTFQVALSSIFSFYLKDFGLDISPKKDKDSTVSIKVYAKQNVLAPVKVADTTELEMILNKGLLVKPQDISK